MRNRLILRALHALIRAQLRQRDYLSIEEITELETIERDLRPSEASDMNFYVYGRTCKQCGSVDLRISAGVVKCFNCQSIQSPHA